jgi:hypothetical protein
VAQLQERRPRARLDHRDPQGAACTRARLSGWCC